MLVAAWRWSRVPAAVGFLVAALVALDVASVAEVKNKVLARVKALASRGSTLLTAALGLVGLAGAATVERAIDENLRGYVPENRVVNRGTWLSGG